MAGNYRHLRLIPSPVSLSSSSLEQHRRLPFLFYCCLPLLLMGCAGTLSAQSKPADPTQVATPHGAHVSFARSTSYEEALQLITDLGLQFDNPCIRTGVDSHGAINSWIKWSPIGDKHLFTLTQGMWVASTALAPSDWADRLKVLSGVVDVETNYNIMCPAMPGTPPPGTTIALVPRQAGTYARITFSLQGDQYQSALSTVSTLGLRLADPCYERTRRTLANWHAMGQEAPFARSRTLLVATTDVSPDNWQKQLRASADVASIQVPAPVQC